MMAQHMPIRQKPNVRVTVQIVIGKYTIQQISWDIVISVRMVKRQIAHLPVVNKKIY